MMEGARKNKSSRSLKQTHTKQRRDGLYDSCDQSGISDDTTKSSFLFERVSSAKPWQLERPIDPELTIASHQEKTFDKECYPGSRMIKNWQNKFFGKGDRLTGNEEQVVEAARIGLMTVGETECFSCDVLKRINREFNMVKVKSRNKILLYCISLYTRNIFVYRVVNQALRNDDESQSETLGPFCYLLTVYLYDRQTPVYKETVFRGCQLESSTIDEYRQVKKQQQRVKWLGFTSTSKSINVAQQFHCNVIFKIDLSQFKDRFQYGRPVDISNLSEMPQEEEVLLPAGFNFIVEEVGDNVNDDKGRSIFIEIRGIP